MQYRALVSALTLAVAIGAFSGAAVAQDSGDRDRPWWHGPWHTPDDDWGMMGPGMMGPGMMMGRGMMPMMLLMMDTDGDGAVSLEEMQAVHKRMFDMVDADKDGKVTVEEMKGFRGAWSDDN